MTEPVKYEDSAIKIGGSIPKTTTFFNIIAGQIITPLGYVVVYTDKTGTRLDCIHSGVLHTRWWYEKSSIESLVDHANKFIRELKEVSP